MLDAAISTCAGRSSSGNVRTAVEGSMIDNRLRRSVFRWTVVANVVAAATSTAFIAAPSAGADNKRLNNSIVANIYTIQKQAGCTTAIRINPQLRLAAQWHTEDVLNNRSLDGDIGSDGSSVQNRAEAAGYRGPVAETVEINPALAISGLDLLNRWYYNPDYLAIMQNCANTEVGVWSENSLERTVVVAVYGHPV
jgi:uncharacterized protein YkwD